MIQIEILVISGILIKSLFFTRSKFQGSFSNSAIWEEKLHHLYSEVDRLLDTFFQVSSRTSWFHMNRDDNDLRSFTVPNCLIEMRN